MYFIYVSWLKLALSIEIAAILFDVTWITFGFLSTLNKVIIIIIIITSKPKGKLKI